MHRGCILALLQWLWLRGKTGRAIAALAELSDCEGEASSWHGDLRWELHWQFGRRLPLCYSTHTCRRRSAHLTGRSRGCRALPTGYQTMRLSHHASLRSETGWLLEVPPVVPRVTESQKCLSRTPGPPTTPLSTLPRGTSNSSPPP
jgi:hypothetical protein